MKIRLSISIDEVAYNTCLKGRKNVSAYIEDLLRSQYVEDNKVTIAKKVLEQIRKDDDLKRYLKDVVNEYMQERRAGDWS